MAVGGQFGREAFVYLLGFLGAGVIQFLAIPIYSRALGPEQFGQLTFTLALTTALTGVMALGGDVALARLWADTPTESGRKELASTWISFLAGWSTLVAIAACALTPWVVSRFDLGSDLGPILVVGILGLIPTLLSSMLAQILRNRFRPIPYALTTVLVMAINVAMGVGLAVGLGLGVYGIVLGTLIGQTVGGLVRLPLVWGTLGLEFSTPALRRLLRLGVPFVPASLATWSLTGADRLVLGATVSPDQLGAYGLVAMLMGAFTVVTLAMGQAWIPRISAVNARDPEAARVSTALAVGVALSSFGAAASVLSTVSPWLVGVVGGPAYASGAAALPFLALGAALAGTSLFTGTVLTLEKRTGLVAVVTLAAAAVNVALLLFLVPRLGLVGASLSVAGAFFTLACGTLLISVRRFGLAIEVHELAIGCGLLTGQAIIATALPGNPVTWVTLAGVLTGLGLQAWIRLREARNHRDWVGPAPD